VVTARNQGSDLGQRRCAALPDWNFGGLVE
jgi:hypothetical protein